MKKSIFNLPFLLLAALAVQLSCSGTMTEHEVPGGAPAPPWYQDLQTAPTELGAVVNASRFGESIYFGGQFQPEDMEVLRQKGIKTVVNLRRTQEMESLQFDEGQVLQEAGIAYHHIPFGHDIPPDEESLQTIAELLDHPDNHPLLLHCASSNRVGYTWARFRALRHNLPLDQAVEEGKSAGMRALRFEAHLQEVVPPSKEH